MIYKFKFFKFLPKLIPVVLIGVFFLFTSQIKALQTYTEGSVLFSDNFSDGNLNGWTIESGTWGIDSLNRLFGIGNGTLKTGRLNPAGSWDNYKLEVDVQNDNGVDEGIGFRRSDGNNSYELNLRHNVNGLYNTPQVVLRKVQDGQSSTLFETSRVSLEHFVTYKVKIEVVNEHIQVWIDSNLLIDLDDPGTKLKQGGVSLSYWTGDLGSVNVRFDNVKVTALNAPSPTPTPSPTPSPTPIPTPTPEPSRYPLIFIPGMGGSELKVSENTNWSAPDGHGGTYTNTYQKDEKVWVNEGEAAKPGNDDYFDILRMNIDGITSAGPIELTGNIYSGAYQETIDFFTENGYELNKSLFIFPFDWRKDITHTKPLLDSKIAEIKNSTGINKVDIVAHSMGGLVARYYIADSNKAKNVRKLITLGTLYLGSVNPMIEILYGSCLRFSVGPLCLSFAPSETKDVLHNMIGTYQLLPSKTYFNFYTGNDPYYPFPFKDERDIDSNGILGELNYAQTKQLLTNLGQNTSLYSFGESFHDLDNSYLNTNGVETYLVVGSGVATPGQIVERSHVNFFNQKIPKKDIISINGDKTVPLFSASLDDPNRKISLKGEAKVYYTNQNHEELALKGLALDFTKNILSNNPSIPQGVFEKPYKLNGLQLSVHSPVNLHAYDTFGNHTGPTTNGDFENNIPGSTYDTLDDAKFIWLPEDGQYSIKFEAIDQGSFDFKIREFEDNINDKITLYKDVLLNNSTKGETQLDTTSIEPPILLMDNNGDGTTDTQISPTSTLTGLSLQDQTTPISEAKLSGDLGKNNWYKTDVKVELTATDNTSGVSKIEYSLDNGQTIQTYTNPFTLNKEGVNKLKFRSIDKAGNEENPIDIEIKIDNTPPEANIIFNTNTQSFDIKGLDNLSEVTQTEQVLGTIILIDQAGNDTKLEVLPKSKIKKDRIEIKSITYNNGVKIVPPINRFNVTYLVKSGKINVFDQIIIINSSEVLRAFYSLKSNKTRLESRQLNGKYKAEEIIGTILLKFNTKRGSLEATY